MKLTLSWLKEHLETDASLTEICEAVTAIGLELESVDDRAAKLAPFVVGYVVEARKHPDADRLRVCIVDTGKDQVQVVCGAPNARTGMKGVFARAGLVVPGTGLLLKAGTIRGQASNGMLCSAREMGLSDEHDGIIDLPADAPVGEPFARTLGRDDAVIDVAITPNRQDCLGVRGIARDLAAKGVGRLKPRRVEPVPGRFESPLAVRFDLPADAAKACPYFVGRMLRGVRNGPSPRWLQDRLIAIGLRPISALVDITNYMTFDICRPLHVFDAAKVERGIVVRLARPGETIAALNGKTYTLSGSETVISDEGGAAEGLGGVIGGEESGCTEATTDVFVEAALFDPIRTAQTGRAHQILSDARYRFERGIDPEAVIEGMEAATRMILDLCGGEASELVVAGKVPEWRRSYRLRKERAATLGGVDVPPADQRRILEALGFAVEDHGATFEVAPPSWRQDIHGEADLVEEIGRIWGYDRIAAVPMPRDTALPAPALTPAQRRVRDARRALAGLGLVEAVTFSFMQKSVAALFGGTNPTLELLNPISSDLDFMRPTIVPNLLLAARRNADRGLGGSALCEVGPQFADDTPAGQSMMATGLRSGDAAPRSWGAKQRAVDALDAKADALALLQSLGAPVENLQTTRDAPSWYHPGRSGCLRLGAKVVAVFGELNPRVLAAMDVRMPAVAFEVTIDAVPMPKAKAGRARQLLKLAALQPVERDFAFLVDSAVESEKLVRAIRGVAKEIATQAAILSVGVFDVYEGKGLPEGRKSVALSVRLQPAERTLTDAEIDAIGQRMVAAAAKATGAALRG
jgi:phenylalanyl-tRNA synthetase beta chain